MRIRGARTWALAAVAAVVAGTLAALPSPPRIAPTPSWRQAATEVRGAYHVHTIRSDGGGTVDDAAAGAARAGLQFVILSDHGDGTRRPDPPAYRHGVLCIDAVEISTRSGHYGVIGLGQAPYPLGGEARDVVEDVRRLGGFGIANHPLSPKAGLAWTDWEQPVDAIEWLNDDSLWRDAPRFRLALAAWTFAFRPAASLVSLYGRPAALDRADRTASRRRVVLIAGADVHSRIGSRSGNWYVRVPSYESAFETASIRVRIGAPLGGDAATDADAIVRAIRAGHLHSVVDGLAGPGAFDFAAASGGVSAGEGDRLPLSGAVTVRAIANTPEGGFIVLLRDGREIDRVSGGRLVYAGNRQGVYRAEVRLRALRGDGWVPWIVGNPVYVGTIDEPDPAPPAVAGEARPVADDLQAWRVEAGEGSSGSVERDGPGVMLRYALAGRPGPPPDVSFVVRAFLDPRAEGFSFVGRADRPMRVVLRVRTGTDRGGATIGRSVYLDEMPREVTVAVSDMRPVSASAPPSPGGLRDARIVVDTTNTRRGESGHLSVEGLRVIVPR